MINPNDLTATFIQMRRALWANDHQMALRSSERIGESVSGMTSHNDRESDNNEHSGFHSFHPEKALLRTVEILKANLETVNESGFYEKYYLVQTQNLRAFVFRESEHQFKLKGYLVNLELEGGFYQNARSKALEFNAELLNKDTNSKDVLNEIRHWTTVVGEMRISTVIGDFGLFEMTGTLIGKTIRIQSINEVLHLFTQNLKELEIDDVSPE